MQLFTRIIKSAPLLALLASLTSCATGGGSSVAGNDGGSAPVNEGEINEYKRAVHKCYKTGGTRVVKVTGKLRCY